MGGGRARRLLWLVSALEKFRCRARPSYFKVSLVFEWYLTLLGVEPQNDRTSPYRASPGGQICCLHVSQHALHDRTNGQISSTLLALHHDS